jgi:hypothetical protein
MGVLNYKMAIHVVTMAKVNDAMATSRLTIQAIASSVVAWPEVGFVAKHYPFYCS